MIYKSKTTLKGAKQNRINILLLGIGGGKHKGALLTDTIALLSVNPQTYESAILSIPRDLYVKIPKTNSYTKINALYTYGIKNENTTSNQAVSLVKKSVENITGQKIHYYIILDFDGFKEIINTLGGIDLEVENDILDHHYPGPNYSYETFKLSKGFHHLDADTALKYARVRHIKGGDFGRARRQQQIIASVREKALSLKILTNPFKINAIFDSLGNHLKTNIQPNEIIPFIKLAKNINIHQTTNEVLDAWSKDSLLKSTHIPLGGVQAYVLIPKDKSYSSIQNLAKNIFNLKTIEETKKKINQEKAKIAVLVPSYNAYVHFKTLFQKWDYHIQPYNYIQYSKFCQPNKETIINYSTKNKLFTLSDLAGKFNLNIQTVKPKKSDKKNIDIILCLFKNSYKYFTEEDGKVNQENLEENNELNIIDEKGNVIINKN